MKLKKIRKKLLSWFNNFYMRLFGEEPIEVKQEYKCYFQIGDKLHEIIRVDADDDED